MGLIRIAGRHSDDKIEAGNRDDLGLKERSDPICFKEQFGKPNLGYQERVDLQYGSG